MGLEPCQYNDVVALLHLLLELYLMPYCDNVPFCVSGIVQILVRILIFTLHMINENVLHFSMEIYCSKIYL